MPGTVTAWSLCRPGKPGLRPGLVDGQVLCRGLKATGPGLGVDEALQ